MSVALPNRFPLLLAGIVALGALLRFADLPADPPKGLSWSQGIYTDGAVVVQNARNQILWGKPVLDYGIDLYWFPFSYAATLATFRTFGVSSTAARATSAVLGLGAIACVALALRSERNSTRALVAAGLLAVSFPFVMFNRIPLAEPGMILLMALGFLFFSLGSARGSARLLAASGFFATSAPLFGKAHAVTFPIVGLLALVLGRPDERSRPRVSAYVAGCLAAGLLWAAVLILPHGREIIDHFLHESVVKHESSPRKGAFLAESAANALAMGARSGFFSRDLVMTTLAFCAIPILIARRAIAREMESASVRFAALWLLFGWAFLACVKAPAPRYLSALFPAMAVLASELLFGRLRETTTRGGAEARGERETETKRRGRASDPRRARGGARVAPGVLAAVFGFAFLAAAVTIAHVGRLATALPAVGPLVDPIPMGGDPGFPWTIAPAAGILALVATLLLVRSRGRVPIPRAASVVLLGLSLLLTVTQFASWAPRRTHHLVTAGRAIGRILGPEAHLVGAYAPAVCLDNRLRVSPYFGPEYMGPDKDPDLFAHYAITHVILVGPDDLKTLEERYPDVAAGLTLVAVYPFDSQYSRQIALLRVPARIGDRVIHHYEPTAAERASEVAVDQLLRTQRGAS